VKRDHGEAAYSRAGLISDSPENAFKRCDRGGGKSFRVPRRRRLRPRARPSHLPQVPRRARSARLPSQNTSSVSKRSAGRRGQRAARAARLAPDLGCAARRRRTHGRMDGRTDRHAAKSGCALAAKHVTWHAAPPEGSTGGHPPLRHLRHLRAGGGRLARRGSPGHPARRHRGDKRRAAPPPQLCYFSQPEFTAAPATAAFQRPRRSPPRPAHRAAGAEQLARRRPAAAATSAARRSRGPAPPRPPRASPRTCRQPGAGWERCSGQLCGAGAAGEPGRSGRRRALPRTERALGAEGRAASGGRSEDGGSAAARPSRPDTPTGLGSGGATAAV